MFIIIIDYLNLGVLKLVLEMVLNRVRERIEPLINGIVRYLDAVGFSPWHISLISILLVIVSFLFLYYYLHPSIFTVIAVAIFLLAGAMDGLDGALARYKNKVSRWGGFYDSFIDRLVEIVFILGLLLADIITALPAYLYIATSILISYSRARAEALGLSLSGVGIMERAERILILSLFLIIYVLIPFNFDIMMYILIILNTITVSQRVLKVYDGLKREHT